MTGKVAVITGGSQGIGAGLAAHTRDCRTAVLPSYRGCPQEALHFHSA